MNNEELIKLIEEKRNEAANILVEAEMEAAKRGDTLFGKYLKDYFIERDTIIKRFKFIETAVNEAIEEAVSVHGSGAFDGDAINWADLRCATVEFVVNEHGDYYHAIVEEADPTSYKLREFIQKKIDAISFCGQTVWVETEW